ncbi:MAG: peptidylprolyl isomerase [Planctomycetaceae bacterium]|jgi:cyclophilin family peptidyl-prolyl cis-trans isomerase|nr:peptidylprolyl isomerase [Planctomycetaceae bacterium]
MSQSFFNRTFVSLCTVLLTVLPTAFAQQPPQQSPEQLTEEQAIAQAVSLGVKNKNFMDGDAKFKAMLREMTVWKSEYPHAKAARQKEIEQLYPKRRAEAEQMRRNLVELAMQAFDEAPHKNPFVNDLLYRLVHWEFWRDNYELSYNAFKKIATPGLPKEAETLYVFGGLSAMMVMQLDDAEAWIRVSRENGQYRKFMEELSRADEKTRQAAMSFDGMLLKIPEFRKSWAEEDAIRKRETEAGVVDPSQKLPRVLLKTSKGDIVIELFENEAPNTVANFISLVEKGFYTNVLFHRVLPQFMAQGGDPEGTGGGGPGYCIPDECNKPGYRRHFRGSLSMAKTALPDTGGSQFFLTFVPTSFLDGKHTVFGRVVEGIDVLADLQRIDPSDEEQKVPQIDKIIEAKVLNKRNHQYTPRTLPGR